MTTIKVTLIKSIIGTKQDHRATIRGLGLGKMNSSSILKLTPSISGMLNKVNYLIRVEENATK